MVSQEAAEQVKVILGGQGGDEIFGGYTRYLVAYFEQCIKGAIDGTLDSGNFVVTYESIIPNLVRCGTTSRCCASSGRRASSSELDARYYRLINRAHHVEDEVDVAALGDYSPFETFQEIFNGPNVGHQAYFDKMTHFDFKTLLPALLQVEDRVSMAHGLESRVPLLDHRLIELAATIPADIKFRDGDMKHIFKKATEPILPERITERKDKMGFPVPLSEWMRGDAKDFVDGHPLERRGAGPRADRQRARSSRAWPPRRPSAARCGGCSRWSCGSGRSTTAAREFRKMLLDSAPRRRGWETCRGPTWLPGPHAGVRHCDVRRRPQRLNHASHRPGLEALGTGAR